MRACVLTDWEKLEMKEIPRPVPVERRVLTGAYLSAGVGPAAGEPAPVQDVCAL